MEEEVFTTFVSLPDDMLPFYNGLIKPIGIMKLDEYMCILVMHDMQSQQFRLGHGPLMKFGQMQPAQKDAWAKLYTEPQESKKIDRRKREFRQNSASNEASAKASVKECFVQKQKNYPEGKAVFAVSFYDGFGPFIAEVASRDNQTVADHVIKVLNKNLQKELFELKDGKSVAFKDMTDKQKLEAKEVLEKQVKEKNEKEVKVMETKFVTKLSITPNLMPFYASLAQSVGMKLAPYFMHLVIEDLRVREFDFGPGKTATMSNADMDDIESKGSKLISKWNEGKQVYVFEKKLNELRSLNLPASEHEARRKEIMAERDRIDALNDDICRNNLAGFFAEEQTLLEKPGEEVSFEFNSQVAPFIGISAKKEGRNVADFITGILQRRLDTARFEVNGGDSIAYKDLTHSQRIIARQWLEAQQQEQRV